MSELPTNDVAICSLSGPPPVNAKSQEFEAMQAWAKNWLSKANPDLGRDGPVCPFTGSSIGKDLFRVSFMRGSHIDRNRISGALHEIAAIFPNLSPVDGPDALLKTVVLVLPDISDYKDIDAIQLEFKNLFVRSGLMVGQFYPGCEQQGLWNPEFRPLDAPLPMLAIRHMVSSDYPFLRTDQDWMNAYLRKFAPEIPARIRTDIVRRVISI